MTGKQRRKPHTGMRDPTSPIVTRTPNRNSAGCQRVDEADDKSGVSDAGDDSVKSVGGDVANENLAHDVLNQ